MSHFTLNLIDHSTAEAIRRTVRKEAAREDLDRSTVGIFRPIEYDVATGRARCRECGERIPKGERCVAFQLDLYIKRTGKWGNLVRAYVHVKCEQEGAP